MKTLRLSTALALLCAGSAACAVGGADGVQDLQAAAEASGVQIERVSTSVPFPRGLALVEGKLYVLCRGRVRQYGGVNAGIDDEAGSLYEVDTGLAQPFEEEISEAVRTNGRVLTRPTGPPFRLFDRTAQPPTADRETDRPYCTLRWHEPTRSFYICAFSGIDKDSRLENNFSKNLTDAVLRYDLRTAVGTRSSVMTSRRAVSIRTTIRSVRLLPTVGSTVPTTAWWSRTSCTL